MDSSIGYVFRRTYTVPSAPSDVYSKPSGMLAMKCLHCTRLVVLKMTNEGDVRAEKLS